MTNCNLWTLLHFKSHESSFRIKKKQEVPNFYPPFQKMYNFFRDVKLQKHETLNLKYLYVSPLNKETTKSSFMHFVVCSTLVLCLLKETQCVFKCTIGQREGGKHPWESWRGLALDVLSAGEIDSRTIRQWRLSELCKYRVCLTKTEDTFPVKDKVKVR